MYGTLDLPVRRSGKDMKPSSSAMDLESIRARRARLEDIISMMRLPPLTRCSSMTNTPSIRDQPIGNYTTAWRRRRRSLETPSRRSPESFVPLTPMTIRPSIQPLPDIGSSLRSTPSVSRQVSGKRKSEVSSCAITEDEEEELDANSRRSQFNSLNYLNPPNHLEKRPATSKSRSSVLSSSSESDSGADIPCNDDIIADIVRGMGSNSKDKRMTSTVKARKLLSREDNPPIAPFLKAGVLTPLIPLLQGSENTKLQFEATWTLTNLASGSSEQTGAIVNVGAIPILVDLLKSSDENVQEQASWALGNIAGDGVYYRNLVVQAGVVNPLMDSLKLKSGAATAKLAHVRVVSWVLANIFRHKGLTMPMTEKQKCIDMLKLFVQHTDTDVNVDALWGISYLSDLDEESLDAVVSAGMVPQLMRHLRSNEINKMTPALRAIGNVAAGDDTHTDTALDNQVLQVVKPLLDHNRRKIRKDATWTVSNITAGNKRQIQRVIDERVLPKIIDNIRCGLLDVQKEATWTAANLTAGGSEEQMAALIDADAVPALVQMLSIGETDIITVALQALHSLMKISGRQEEVKDIVAGERGLAKLDVLRQYVDPSISEKAEDILKLLTGDGYDAGGESDASY